MNSIHYLMEKRQSKLKRKRKVLSLQTKVDILNRLRNGETTTSVARCYELNESSVRTIKKQEEVIRRSIATCRSRAAKVACKTRNTNLEKAEKALSLWIEHQTMRKIPLSSDAIRTKMIKIYNRLLESNDGPSSRITAATTDGSGGGNETPENKNFRASKGWFENFKKRHRIHSLKNLTGNESNTISPAETEFEKNLKKFIKDENYHPDQVFNAVEINLFWKRIPSHPFISDTDGEEYDPGYSTATDRVTVFFCTNASGECILKPMILYRSDAMIDDNSENNDDDKDDDQQSVFLRTNRKPWMTSTSFMDWVRNCFNPTVESYLKRKRLFCKVLLILDNAADHHSAEDVQNSYPNIKVFYFPPNITSPLQSLNQRINKSFKSFYLLQILSIFHSELEDNKNHSVAECWIKFTITDLIGIIKQFLNEFNPEMIVSYWQSIWSGIVTSSMKNNFIIGDNNEEINRILYIAHRIGREGFEQLTNEDIEKFLNNDDEEFNEDDLLQLTDYAMDTDDEDEIEKILSTNQEEHHEKIKEEDLLQLNDYMSVTMVDEEKPKPAKPFTLKEIDRIFKAANKLKDLVGNLDSQQERIDKFKNEIDAAMQPYEQLKKTLLDLI